MVLAVPYSRFLKTIDIEDLATSVRTGIAISQLRSIMLATGNSTILYITLATTSKYYNFVNVEIDTWYCSVFNSDSSHSRTTA